MSGKNRSRGQGVINGLAIVLMLSVGIVWPPLFNSESSGLAAGEAASECARSGDLLLKSSVEGCPERRRE
jgi:hypothetical protein